MWTRKRWMRRGSQRMSTQTWLCISIGRSRTDIIAPGCVDWSLVDKKRSLPGDGGGRGSLWLLDHTSWHRTTVGCLLTTLGGFWGQGRLSGKTWSNMLLSLSLSVSLRLPLKASKKPQSRSVCESLCTSQIWSHLATLSFMWSHRWRGGSRVSRPVQAPGVRVPLAEALRSSSAGPQRGVLTGIELGHSTILCSHCRMPKAMGLSGNLSAGYC